MCFQEKPESAARNTVWQTTLLQYPSSDDQKLLKNMKTFSFESVYAQENNVCDIDMKTWISKHIQISGWHSSILIGKPYFFCNSNPGAVVESLVDGFEGLATDQSGNKIKVFGDSEELTLSIFHRS